MEFLDILKNNPPHETDTTKSYVKKIAEIKGIQENSTRTKLKQWMGRLGFSQSVSGVREWLEANEIKDGLLKVRETTDKNGAPITTTYGKRENLFPDISGMKVTKVTKMPYGGAYVSYANSETSFLTEDYLSGLSEKWKKEITPIKINNTQKGKLIVTIVSSDKHVGAAVSKNSIYQNDYSKQVYKSRMKKVLQDAVDQINGRTISELVYFDLGDNLDGYKGKTTRGGHDLPQNLNSREQFDAFLEVEKWFIDNLLALVKTDKFTYRATSEDNHAGAFGYTAYRAFSEYLNAKYIGVDAKVSKSFLDHLKIGNKWVIYTHGKDEEDRKSGLPLNLDVKTENYINEYIDYHGLTGEVVVLKGDLHQYSVNVARRFTYINVPAIFGSSKWIHNNFGNTKPGFYFEIGDGAFHYDLSV